MTNEQVIEVGKALLPYLRTDLRPEELGTAAHDAAAALRRANGIPPGLTDLQRLALQCGNVPYEDDKVCPKCDGRGYVEFVPPFIQRRVDEDNAVRLLRGLGYNVSEPPESSAAKSL